MLNISPFSAWVKNVYSLCVEGVITRVHSYTNFSPLRFIQLQLVVQTPLSPLFIDSFPPALYTAKNSFLPLIDTLLYTLSTAPTIKKMK
jgi:hypothetical protein